jgi:hypothetical protein
MTNFSYLGLLKYATSHVYQIKGYLHSHYSISAIDVQFSAPNTFQITLFACHNDTGINTFYLCN